MPFQKFHLRRPNFSGSYWLRLIIKTFFWSPLVTMLHVFPHTAANKVICRPASNAITTTLFRCCGHSCILQPQKRSKQNKPRHSGKNSSITVQPIARIRRGKRVQYVWTGNCKIVINNLTPFLTFLDLGRCKIQPIQAQRQYYGGIGRFGQKIILCHI